MKLSESPTTSEMASVTMVPRHPRRQTPSLDGAQVLADGVDLLDVGAASEKEGRGLDLVGQCKGRMGQRHEAGPPAGEQEQAGISARQPCCPGRDHARRGEPLFVGEGMARLDHGHPVAALRRPGSRAASPRQPRPRGGPSMSNAASAMAREAFPIDRTRIGPSRGYSRPQRRPSSLRWRRGWPGRRRRDARRRARRVGSCARPLSARPGFSWRRHDPRRACPPAGSCRHEAREEISCG